MPLLSLAKMYILLYEKMSIYLCQKKYKQSYLLQRRYHITDGNRQQIQHQTLRGNLTHVGPEHPLYGNLHPLVLHIHQHLAPDAYKRENIDKYGEQPQCRLSSSIEQ